jgi:protein-disulfide isomerase
LYQIHPQAQKAAEAAECAGEQGKFWEMHDALFESQQQWSGKADAEDTFASLAADLGLNEGKFESCLDSGTYASRVDTDYQEGLSAGVTGTPAFMINEIEMSGAQPFSAFQQQIDFLLAGGSPPSLEVAADSYRSMGRADAPVVVTEFSDYQCPACSTIEQQVIPDLIEQYVDTGKVRFVYREYPLDSLHPNARKASEAAVCAGEQGNYWEMHEKLFASQAEWGEQVQDPTDFFKAYAAELGFDTEAFDQCLDSGDAAVVVQGEVLAGQSLGVNATPFFFIGDVPIRGGLPIESMGQIIDYVAAGGKTPEIVPQGEDWHLLGNKDTAQAVTVAFVDFASPESRDHAIEVFPQMQREYVDSGQMLYVIHPWSSTSDGPSAQAAAAAECAGQQGKFWEMYEQLFEAQDTWTTEEEPRPLFIGYAEELDLDTGEVETCLDSEWAALRVKAGNVVGAIYGIPGAPVFLFNNGSGQQGSPTFEEFQGIIDSILNGQ